MLFIPRKNTKLGWQDTTWNFSPTERKEQILAHVKALGLNLVNKKILCLAGGVGRNANALRELCDDVTNSDYEDFYLNIGKKLYPEVKHINYDMNDDPHKRHLNWLNRRISQFLLKPDPVLVIGDLNVYLKRPKPTPADNFAIENCLRS